MRGNFSNWLQLPIESPVRILGVKRKFWLNQSHHALSTLPPMYNITLVCTRHHELGRCNSDGLFNILEDLNPEVIFDELPSDSFDKYYGYSSEMIYINSFLQNRHPDDNVAESFSFDRSSGWIHFGMLHDMRDNTVENTALPGVMDNVNAYNMSQIFSGYQSNVTTVQGFKGEVLSRNANRQSTEMNQLVTSYHY